MPSVDERLRAYIQSQKLAISAIGTKQTLVSVASMSALEVKRASSAPEGHVCF
jgi:hypothetical protein